MDTCIGDSGENFKHGMNPMDERKSIPKIRAGIHSNGGEHRKNGGDGNSLETAALGNESTNTMSTETGDKQHRWNVQRLAGIAIVISFIVAVMSFIFSEYVSVLRYSYVSQAEIKQIQSENIRIRKKQEEFERRLSLLEIQQQELLSTFYAVRESVDFVRLYVDEFRRESETGQKASDFISPEKRESRNE